MKFTSLHLFLLLFFHFRLYTLLYTSHEILFCRTFFKKMNSSILFLCSLAKNWHSFPQMSYWQIEPFKKKKNLHFHSYLCSDSKESCLFPADFTDVVCLLFPKVI